MCAQTVTTESDATAGKRAKGKKTHPVSQEGLGGMTSLVAAQQEMFEKMVAANLEMIDFVNRRAQANADTIQSLAACKDWQEMADVQNRFITETAKEYVEHTVKLMETATVRLAAFRSASET